MDHPFLVGFVILGVVWLIGMAVEKGGDWSKAAGAAAFIALGIACLALSSVS